MKDHIKHITEGLGYKTKLRARPGKSQLRLRIRRLLRSFPVVAARGKKSLKDEK